MPGEGARPQQEITMAARSSITTDHADDANDVAHALGRDFARHGLPLPDGMARADSPLWCGWQAGEALFAARPWPADLRTRRWLHLRLRAWQRGEAVELARVTPHLVGRLDSSHCPVTRRPLRLAALTDPSVTPHPDDALLVTLDRDRGVDAGLIVMLSRRAAAVLDSHDLDDLRELAYGTSGDIATGLTAPQRDRLATLLGYVSPSTHVEAALQPLRLLPPNRLRVVQPVQALQALLSRMLLRSGWTARLQGWQALLPHAAQRDALQRFFLALLARVLEAGHAADPLQRRWAIEDAWRDAEVLRLWTRLALQLDAATCAALVERAAERGLCDTAVLNHPDADEVAQPVPARVRLQPAHALRPVRMPRRTPLLHGLTARRIPPSHPVQLNLPWAA
ncbi:hypothetical protein ACWA7J_08040 [Leptothrix sp. BB-4]